MKEKLLKKAQQRARQTITAAYNSHFIEHVRKPIANSATNSVSWIWIIPPVFDK